MAEAQIVRFPSGAQGDALRREAAERRARFLLAIKGAETRAGLLQRDLLPALGIAAADLMLVQIVNGTLTPRNAKEAVEIAKAAIQIARDEIGEAPVSARPETAEVAASRAARVQTVTTLQQQLRERAAAAKDAAAVEAARLGVDPEDEWVFPDEP